MWWHWMSLLWHLVLLWGTLGVIFDKDLLIHTQTIFLELLSFTIAILLEHSVSERCRINQFLTLVLVGCFKIPLNSLQLIWNVAGRVLRRIIRKDHIYQVLSFLHWFCLKSRIEFKIPFLNMYLIAFIFNFVKQISKELESAPSSTSKN